MAIKGVPILFARIAVVGANYWGAAGGCPYLKKVVPQGKVYVDVASELLHSRTTDCAAFSKRFSEHFNFTFETGRIATTPEEAFAECSEAGGAIQAGDATLKSVFPAFSTSDMVFEVLHKHGERQTWGLAALHFCSKSKKTMWGHAVTSNFESAPKALREVGERFLQQIYEKYDCSVYASLMEDGTTVKHHGEPSLVTRGRETVFHGPKLAQAVCEQKVAKEKRVHTYAKLLVSRYYYDASRMELTIVAERRVETIFKPGVRGHPIAVTLQFSPAGKVKAVQFYETEALHIEQKWGSKYGVQEASETQSQAASSGKEKALIGETPAHATTQTQALRSVTPAHATTKTKEVVLQEAPADPRLIDLLWSNVSAAADRFSAC